MSIPSRPSATPAIDQKMKHLLTMLSYKVYLQNFEQGTLEEKQVIEVDSAKSLEQLPEKGGIPCAIVPRTETLVVCPLNKLTLDLRGVSTVRAGIAVRRPVRPRASNRKIISGTYH